MVGAGDDLGYRIIVGLIGAGNLAGTGRAEGKANRDGDEQRDILLKHNGRIANDFAKAFRDAARFGQGDVWQSNQKFPSFGFRPNTADTAFW